MARVTPSSEAVRSPSLEASAEGLLGIGHWARLRGGPNEHAQKNMIISDIISVMKKNTSFSLFFCLYLFKTIYLIGCFLVDWRPGM